MLQTVIQTQGLIEKDLGCCIVAVKLNVHITNGFEIPEMRDCCKSEFGKFCFSQPSLPVMSLRVSYE